MMSQEDKGSDHGTIKQTFVFRRSKFLILDLVVTILVHKVGGAQSRAVM